MSDAPGTLPEVVIDAVGAGEARGSTRGLGDFRPMTVDEADQALVNGLIDVPLYCRCLLAVEPLVDTLQDADAGVRKEATFALKKRGGRQAVKLLEQALDDASEEVRLFAAEALEKLDSMYGRAVAGLVERVAREPSQRLIFVLGKVYFEYAFKGTYDAGLRRLYYEKALEQLGRALAAPGDEDRSAMLLFEGSTLFELGRYREALARYAEVRRLRGEDQDLLVCEAAVHFAEGRYDEVRRICRLVRERHGEGEHAELLRFWAS